MLMDAANMQKGLSSQVSPQHLYASFPGNRKNATDAGATDNDTDELTQSRVAAECDFKPSTQGGFTLSLRGNYQGCIDNQPALKHREQST